METKEKIIDLADRLLREKGFNAFSYKDISNEIGIKTASIHYHFPAKTDLGVAIIKKHTDRLITGIEKQMNLSPEKKLTQLFQYYFKLMADDQVCLIGALATDYNTLEVPIKKEMKLFSDLIEKHTISILEDGIKSNDFKKISNPKNRATLILTTLMGMAQLARVHSKEVLWEAITEIITDLKK